MTLSTCIKEYVRHRRSLGVDFHSEQVQLCAFVKVVGDVALTAVDAEAVDRYIDGKGPVRRAWFSRFNTVAGFYRFAIAREYTTRAPLPPCPPKLPAEFIPYIYSEADVRALLTAVDARYEEDWLVLPQTMRTLLLLLYATGLRISEALALTMADVDLRDAILTIRETKFYKSGSCRLAPTWSTCSYAIAPSRPRSLAVPTRRFCPIATAGPSRVRPRSSCSTCVSRLGWRPGVPDLPNASARFSAHVRDESIDQLVPPRQERAAALAASRHVPRPLQREGNAAIPVYDVGADDGGWPAVLKVRHSGRAT
jgi:hypothetical protein